MGRLILAYIGLFQINTVFVNVFRCISRAVVQVSRLVLQFKILNVQSNCTVRLVKNGPLGKQKKLVDAD
jgi:hypothetical protein